MLKYCLFFTLTFFSLGVYAQNRQQAVRENNQKLFVLAQEYSNDHPSDKKASDLILKSVQLNNSLIDYMNKVSNGNYNSMGEKEQGEYIQSLSASDLKIQQMERAIKKAFKVNHDYFTGVNMEYKNVWESFKASLLSGLYGPPGRRKRSN